jgi:hypothetical protein
MIVGRMASRLGVNFFDREGYSSHKRSKEPPDRPLRPAPQKKAGLLLHFFVSPFCFAVSSPPRWGASLLGLTQAGDIVGMNSVLNLVLSFLPIDCVPPLAPHLSVGPFGSCFLSLELKEEKSFIDIFVFLQMNCCLEVFLCLELFPLAC